jgi:hypothetical protein
VKKKERKGENKGQVFELDLSAWLTSRGENIMKGTKNVNLHNRPLHLVACYLLLATCTKAFLQLILTYLIII